LTFLLGLVPNASSTLFFIKHRFYGSGEAYKEVADFRHSGGCVAVAAKDCAGNATGPQLRETVIVSPLFF
jgi:hypothetical protein